MIKYKDSLYREAETAGETYPDAVAYVHAGGILLFCNVQIAWSGADPADAKQRIDDAVKAVRDVYNQKIDPDVRREVSLGKIEINSTDHQGVVRIAFPLYWEVGDQGFGEVEAWQEILRERGIEVMDHDDWATEYQ